MLSNNKKIDVWAAIALVVANMVGTGVFTSLGFQLISIQNGWSVITLWVVGGIIALFGALCYAEIGSYLTKNGGEYNYLSKLYHPSIGFVAGWTSIIVGFSAPIAAAAVAFSKYLNASFHIENEKLISCLIIILLTTIHLFSIHFGAKFQKIITLVKVLLLLIFIYAWKYPGANTELFGFNFSIISKELISPVFAISLIYVSYAYSGWNAAAYVAGEIENPQKNISKALITGTFIVMIIYIFLNASFLYATPINLLKGNVEVGVISAKYIFGTVIGEMIGLIISILLISTISSMLMTAPRVAASIGETYHVFSIFSRKNKFGTPYLSVLLISVLSIIMALTSSFEWLINYIGLTLILFTLLTTIGLFILRKNKNYRPIFKVPFYPIVPILFIAMNIWIMYFVIQSQTNAAYMSLITLAVGFLVYFLISKKNVDKK